MTSELKNFQNFITEKRMQGEDIKIPKILYGSEENTFSKPESDFEQRKADIIEKLLPILDSFEMALKNTADKEKFVKGRILVTTMTRPDFVPLMRQAARQCAHQESLLFG